MLGSNEIGSKAGDSGAVRQSGVRVEGHNDHSWGISPHHVLMGLVSGIARDSRLHSSWRQVGRCGRRILYSRLAVRSGHHVQPGYLRNVVGSDPHSRRPDKRDRAGKRAHEENDLDA